MAHLFYGMNVSLDGFVDHDRFGPTPTLFRHFIDQTEGLAGSIYGRGLYELMHYWDDDQPDWNADHRAFAAAWRKVPKWVASRTLTEFGPNAQLLGPDLVAEVGRLKAEVAGEIEIGGPVLAESLAATGLIDEYRVYLHPVALGSGRPYFRAPRSGLRLMSSEVIDGDVVRLSYREG